MTDLVRWNPFEEISSWHRDIDELFNRLVDRRLQKQGSIINQQIIAGLKLNREGS